MAGRIAVIGSIMTDLVTTVTRRAEWGETLEARGFMMGHGGKGANQAVAAARLGAAVTMVGKVGDDAFGERSIAALAGHGIDTRHVGTAAGRSSGVASITVDGAGENAILIVKGANDDLSPDDVERAGADLRCCDLILLQLEVPAETVYAAIAFGARHGIPTLLNPAPASATLDVERVRDARFLVPNETELRLLSGLPVDSAPEVEAAARSLMARGIGTVIVTRGSRGALLVEPEGSTAIAPVPVVPVDTTGAGDAFIGCFARYYAADRDARGALARAARYAADSITRPGTQGAYATEAAFLATEKAGDAR